MRVHIVVQAVDRRARDRIVEIDDGCSGGAWSREGFQEDGRMLSRRTSRTLTATHRPGWPPGTMPLALGGPRIG
jgi:hypothetical protein